MEEMQKAFNKTIIKLQNTSRIAQEQVCFTFNGKEKKKLIHKKHANFICMESKYCTCNSMIS